MEFLPEDLEAEAEEEVEDVPTEAEAQTDAEPEPDTESQRPTDSESSAAPRKDAEMNAVYEPQNEEVVEEMIESIENEMSQAEADDKVSSTDASASNSATAPASNLPPAPPAPSAASASSQAMSDEDDVPPEIIELLVSDDEPAGSQNSKSEAPSGASQASSIRVKTEPVSEMDTSAPPPPSEAPATPDRSADLQRHQPSEALQSNAAVSVAAPPPAASAPDVPPPLMPAQSKAKAITELMASSRGVVRKQPTRARSRAQLEYDPNSRYWDVLRVSVCVSLCSAAIVC